MGHPVIVSTVVFTKWNRLPIIVVVLALQAVTIMAKNIESLKPHIPGHLYSPDHNCPTAKELKTIIVMSNL